MLIVKFCRYLILFFSIKQPPLHSVGLVNQLSQSTWQAAPQHQMAYPGAHNPLPMSNMYQQQTQVQYQPQPMQTSQQLIGAMRPMGSMSQQQPLAPATTAPVVNNKGGATTNAAGGEAEKKKKNDLLDFDVFSEFHTPTLMTKPITTNQNNKQNTDATDGASQSAINSMLDLSMEPLDGKLLSNTTDTNTNSLLDLSVPAPSAVQQPPVSNTTLPPVQPQQPPIQQQQQSLVQQQQQPEQPKAPVSPPLIHQENYTVPLDALQPGISS